MTSDRRQSSVDHVRADLAESKSGSPSPYVSIYLARGHAMVLEALVREQAEQRPKDRRWPAILRRLGEGIDRNAS